MIVQRNASEARVRAVLAAARRLADPGDELGRAARAGLPQLTGLSPQGVELGLTQHLETDVAPADLAALLARVTPARRVQVVLSANVFVGAVRALALAAAASAEVLLRPSSREPLVGELLVRAFEGGPIDVDRVGELVLREGDEVHVYGRQETIDAIAERCAGGITLRGHGPGCGVALVDAASADLARSAVDLSWDVIAFDQRGCLSPRVVFVEGSEAQAARFAELLARELALRAESVPRGALLPDEVSAQMRYRRVAQMVGSLHEGPSHLVGCETGARAVTLPPAGRCVHVLQVASPSHLRELVAPFAHAITCIGASAQAELAHGLGALAPHARIALIGRMQRPPLDGPVDRRPWYRAGR